MVGVGCVTGVIKAQSMDPNESPLRFPCRFPVKAMGKSRPELDLLVVGIVRRHVADIQEGAVRTRASRGGEFTSVTVTIEASSRTQLDAIYQDLTDCKEVLVAL